MIAKSTRGGNAKGLAAYLHGPGTGDEHRFDETAHGRVIGGNIAPEGEGDGAAWGRTMDRIARRRPEVKKPIYHVSFSAAPGDRTLTAAEWRQVADQWLQTQGCATHPYVLVQHYPSHVHLALSRVGFDRQLWHARKDYSLNAKAMRAAEKQLGLKQLPDRETQRTQPSQPVPPTRAEKMLEQRGVVTWKQQNLSTPSQPLEDRAQFPAHAWGCHTPGKHFPR